MQIINVTEAPIEGQPELVAALEELLADVAADVAADVELHAPWPCVGFTYHGNACGVREQCGRYTTGGRGVLAPTDCVAGCADLIPVAQG